MIKIKRVYKSFAKNDGFRILVDRLWPRGLTKDKAKVDLWLKDIAPSDSLRRWFTHDSGKWKEFKKRYFQELEGKKGVFKIIKERMKGETVTLVYGAKDREYNNAVALKEYLSKNKG